MVLELAHRSGVCRLCHSGVWVRRGFESGELVERGGANAEAISRSRVESSLEVDRCSLPSFSSLSGDSARLIAAQRRTRPRHTRPLASSLTRPYQATLARSPARPFARGVAQRPRRVHTGACSTER